MADELRYEPPVRGGIARLLGPEAGGRSAVTAFVAGLVGLVSFVASLLVDWQRITLRQPEASDVGQQPAISVGLDGASFGVAYLLGVLALLALLGTALTRPELARRLRLAAAGLGVGIAGVLVAVMDQMKDVMTRVYGFRFGFPDGVPPEVQEFLDSATYAPMPGQFLGFGTVAALVAAFWLAAKPATRATTDAAASPVVSADPSVDGAANDSAAPVSPAPGPVGPPGLPPDRPSAGPAWPPARAGYVDGLTVVASDHIDPGPQPDILRS